MKKKTTNHKLQITDTQGSNFFVGYTLIELLVVLLVFSVLAVVVVQSLALSLRGSRKSENLGQVRENTEYSMNVIERNLRNARSVVTCTNTQIVYTDEYNTSPNPRFTCLGGASGYIASGSANLRLTSPDIEIDCTAGSMFVCPTPIPGSGVPPSITITLNANDADSQGAEGAEVTSTTRILLRTY